MVLIYVVGVLVSAKIFVLVALVRIKT